MKKNITTILIAIFVSVVSHASTMVEEVGYDQLVNELRVKKAQTVHTVKSMFTGDEQYQIGFGLVQSMSTYEVAKAPNANPTLSGFEVAGGTKVYGNWFGQGQLRLFSTGEANGVKASAREINAEFFYKESVDKDWSYFIGPGAGVRMSDVETRAGVRTSPFSLAAMVQGGFNYRITPTLSGIAGLGARTPLLSGSDDKGSFDIMIGLGTQL